MHDVRSSLKLLQLIYQESGEMDFRHGMHARTGKQFLCPPARKREEKHTDRWIGA